MTSPTRDMLKILALMKKADDDLKISLSNCTDPDVQLELLTDHAEYRSQAWKRLFKLGITIQMIQPYEGECFGAAPVVTVGEYEAELSDLNVDELLEARLAIIEAVDDVTTQAEYVCDAIRPIWNELLAAGFTVQDAIDAGMSSMEHFSFSEAA